MLHRVIIDYSELNDNDLYKLAAAVFLALTDNPNFTWPVGRLPTFKTKIDDFQEKILAASTNDTVKIAIKNDSRVDLLGETHDMAQDVNRQSEGNLAKLLSSGFTL